MDLAPSLAAWHSAWSYSKTEASVSRTGRLTVFKRCLGAIQVGTNHVEIKLENEMRSCPLMPAGHSELSVNVVIIP